MHIQDPHPPKVSAKCEMASNSAHISGCRCACYKSAAPTLSWFKGAPHHSLTRGCHTQCEFLPHRRHVNRGGTERFTRGGTERKDEIYTRRYRTQRRNDLHEAVPNAKTKRFTRGGTERKDETIYRPGIYMP